MYSELRFVMGSFLNRVLLSLLKQTAPAVLGITTMEAMKEASCYYSNLQTYLLCGAPYLV